MAEMKLGVEHDWRSDWERPDVAPQDAFAVELERFIRAMLRRDPYPCDATRALDWLGEVEAIYQSAARHGEPITHSDFLHYPDKVPPEWQPERLEGIL